MTGSWKSHVKLVSVCTLDSDLDDFPPPPSGLPLQIHKDVFDKHYKAKFLEAGLLAKTRGELQHLISDAATMQVLAWKEGVQVQCLLDLPPPDYILGLLIF